MPRERHERVPGPLLGLELPWPGLIGIGHAERELVVLDLVDSQHPLAARGPAVGDHVDGFGVLSRVEHESRPREVLAVALPDDMRAFDGSRDRPDDLSGRVLTVAPK